MKRTGRQAGFTLVELMIGMVVLGVVLTGVVRMFTNTGRYNTAQEMMVDLTQDLRAVKQLMVQELREAGCDPHNSGNLGFQVDSDDRFDTDSNSIHFTRDIDNGDSDSILEPDGDTDDPNENIRYYRTNDNCLGAAGPVMVAGNNNTGCLRRDSGGGGQPILANVTEFRLRYYKSDGIEKINATEFASKAKLDEIDTVQIIIQAQVEAPSKVSAGAQSQDLDFRVLIRNG